MRNMTEKQVQKMVGTEFIYCFHNGETQSAIIAAFDPKIGLTAVATDRGSKGFPATDGNKPMCLIGIKRTDFGQHEMMQKISERCRIIRDTGKYTVGQIDGCGGGNASCGF